MTLKEKIKELANSKGLSLPNLEAALGFGNGTILKWDKSTPNADKLSKVADYFNVTMDYLLDRELEKNSDMRRIERARNKMSEEQKDRMMKLLELSFEDYFKDDGIE